MRSAQGLCPRDAQARIGNAQQDIGEQFRADRIGLFAWPGWALAFNAILSQGTIRRSRRTALIAKYCRRRGNLLADILLGIADPPCASRADTDLVPTA